MVGWYGDEVADEESLVAPARVTVPSDNVVEVQAPAAVKGPHR